jgi:hypothetical protein
MYPQAPALAEVITVFAKTVITSVGALAALADAVGRLGHDPAKFDLGDPASA